MFFFKIFSILFNNTLNKTNKQQTESVSLEAWYQIRSLTQSNCKLSKQLDQLRQQNQQLTEECDRLCSETKIRQDANDFLHKEVERLERDYNKLYAEYNALFRENYLLQEANTKLIERIAIATAIEQGNENAG